MFARERHRVWLHRQKRVRPHPVREGEGMTWTPDPILQKYRFTNVFRELDKTTVWFRKNIREPMRGDVRVMLATVAFRWFNKIETARELMCGERDLFRGWSSGHAREVLRRSGPPWVTGAYIIKTPDGMDKLDGVLWCIDMFCCKRNTFRGKKMSWVDVAVALRDGPGEFSLQEVHDWLCQSPFLGPFMAYEIVTDLRHTDLLHKAPDIMTWANPGPGARRGLARVHDIGHDAFKNTPSAKLNEMMARLLDQSRMQAHWPRDWPRWEMREVEHTLCEFDKYERVRLGQGRPRGRFHEAT